jgi:phosphoribosylformimino-5-aminoimidazole carboxamide ribotide isomerase
MRIIPAIDILGGKCVRLCKGDYATRKVYSEDPVALACMFRDEGFRYLHLVDLDGARERQVCNLHVLEAIVRETGMTVDFGGGVHSRQSLQAVLNAGAAQVTMGSVAVDNPELFLACLETVGSERLILGADCRQRKVAVGAWTRDTETDVLDFLRDYAAKGVQYSVITDISRDGMLQGPATYLYAELVQASGLQVIASGGISSIADVSALRNAGCSGAIIGKAIYEQAIALKELAALC